MTVSAGLCRRWHDRCFVGRVVSYDHDHDDEDHGLEVKRTIEVGGLNHTNTNHTRAGIKVRQAVHAASPSITSTAPGSS